MTEQTRGRTTVKQLREALAGLPSEHDNVEVRIWLPGSMIYLCGPSGEPAKPFVVAKQGGPVYICLEGNLTPDSALAQL